MFKIKKLLFLAVSLLLLAVGGTLQAKPTLQDARYFPETGFRVDSDMMWEYFQSRGGVDTFGYPVSDLSTYGGVPAQVFQRHVLQIAGSQVRPLNLLDPIVMPITEFGGLTFPAYDPYVGVKAPLPNRPNYGEAVRQNLEQEVPDMWEGEPVGFFSYYLNAAPEGAGELRTLLALEVWGFPTSQLKRDPNNENFIYQRFQRGVMHYDATNQVTRGLLLGDVFKERIGLHVQPDNSSAKAFVEQTLILYTLPEEGKWALKSWPDETLLSDPIFDRFYGQAQLPDFSGLYFMDYHPKLSPNGRYLLLPGVDAPPPPSTLRQAQGGAGSETGTGTWLVDLVERTSRQLLPQAQIATWSPDSAQITYVKGDTLWTLDISEDSTPVALFTHPELSRFYAHWSPAGSSIAVATVSATEMIEHEGHLLRKKTHWLIPTNGDLPRQITNQPAFPGGHMTTGIEWSDDGQFLLLKVYDEVYNLAGEQVLALGGLADWVPHKTDLLRNTRDGMQIITLEGEVVRPDEGRVSQARAREFAFSNDGQRLAYTQEDANDQVQLKVFDLEQEKNIDVGTFPRWISNLNMLNPSAASADAAGTDAKASIVYQHNRSIWIVPAISPPGSEANQSPIELFSSGVLVGVVPMPPK